MGHSERYSGVAPPERRGRAGVVPAARYQRHPERDGVRTIVPAGDPRPPIEEAFKRSALVHTSHIKVHVSRGVVRIDGSALSRAAHDEAVHAAWAAPEITAVEDHI